MSDETVEFGLWEGERFEPDDLDEEFDLSQPHVMTMLGPIEPSELGFTLFVNELFPPPNQINADPATIAGDLGEASQLGLRAIAGLEALASTESMNHIKWIAERSPVHHVLAARPGEPDALAGVIAASWAGKFFSRRHREMLVDATAQQIATRKPLTVDAAGRDFYDTDDLLEFLDRAGASLANTILWNIDWRMGDSGLHKILDTGAFLILDDFDMEDPIESPVAHRLDWIIGSGHASQLLAGPALYSNDDSYSLGTVTRYRDFRQLAPLWLMDAGFPAQQVRAIFIDNPARALNIIRPDPK